MDVNVLVALIDQDHPFHEAAHRWFGDHRSDGWSTCPLTENGALRILNGPQYAHIADRFADVVASVGSLRQDDLHVFWPDDISLLRSDTVHLAMVSSPKEITDVYLLALAAHHGGQLVTFDRRLETRAVLGGQDALLVLSR